MHILMQCSRLATRLKRIEEKVKKSLGLNREKWFTISHSMAAEVILSLYCHSSISCSFITCKWTVLRLCRLHNQNKFISYCFELYKNSKCWSLVVINVLLRQSCPSASILSGKWQQRSHCFRMANPLVFMQTKLSSSGITYCWKAQRQIKGTPMLQ